MTFKLLNKYNMMHNSFFSCCIVVVFLAVSFVYLFVPLYMTMCTIKKLKKSKKKTKNKKQLVALEWIEREERWRNDSTQEDRIYRLACLTLVKKDAIFITRILKFQLVFLVVI